MTLMCHDLSDDLQVAVRVMGDGRLTMHIWDDRLEECRCRLEWDEVMCLVERLMACGKAFEEGDE